MPVNFDNFFGEMLVKLPQMQQHSETNFGMLRVF